MKKLMFVVNTCKVNGNGQQTARTRGTPQNKFVDVSQSANITNSGTILSGMTNVVQGIGVSQRTGDTIFMSKCYINYSINAANADVYSLARIIVFQWKPNSSLAAPTPADVLQTVDPYGMYNWQLSNQYNILYDQVHFLSGTGSAPTAASNQGYFGNLDISRIIKKVEFSPAVAFGSNELYILVISDSAVIPFPTLNIRTRIVYSEE